MKNLKRVLSLGLASVMLVGMMVVGAGAADFTDAEDIVHDEAVQVLVALGVINGKEDGSYFAPQDNVSRAEMAKMIAVILQGGRDVDTGVKTVPSFTDISGNWAESYIEYCADLGIISGRGDGTFDPNGNVTGMEVTKMVLSALGYEAEPYGLTGASWSTNTDKLARTADPKLYDELGNDVVMNQAATRDTAAQIIWNGLQNETRTTTPTQSISTGEVTWEYAGSGKLLITERYDAIVADGDFVGNEYYGSYGASEGEIVVALGSSTDSTGTTTGYGNCAFPYDLDVSYIFEEVKVIWKNGSKSTRTGPDKNDTIYGVFVTGDTQVLNTQMSKVKDNKVANEQKINIDGTKYNLADEVTVIWNLATFKKYTKDGTNNLYATTDANSTLTGDLKKNSGYPMKVLFNDDYEITEILVTESYVSYVTAVNNSSVSLLNFGKLDFDDHDIEEDLEKGDVVSVTPMYDLDPTDSDSYAVVAKCESVSGTVDSYKDDENVVVDGKTYKLNFKNPSGDNDNDCQASASSAAPAKLGLLPTNSEFDNIITTFDTDDNTYIDEEVVLYLIDGYVVAADQTSSGSSNYSVITEVKSGSAAGSTFSGLQLQVMGSDGTKEIITVSDDSVETYNGVETRDKDGTIDSDDYGVGDIITYTFNSDDEAEVIVRAKAVAGTLTYKDSAKTVNGTATASDCVLFVQSASVSLTPGAKTLSSADWDAYDIRTLDAMTKSVDALTIAEKDGKVVAVFANLKGDPDGAESDRVYGIISAYNGRVSDYYSYTVQANGEEYDVLSKDYKGAGSTQALTKGVLVTFKVSADNKYSSGKVEVIGTSAVGTVDSYNTVPIWVDEYSAKDETLAVFTSISYDTDSSSYKGSGSITYALDDDCQIIYVDMDNDKSTGESAVTGFDTTNGWKNAVVVFGKDGTDDVIKAVFVETSGKRDINDKTSPTVDSSYMTVTLP